MAYSRNAPRGSRGVRSRRRTGWIIGPSNSATPTQVTANQIVLWDTGIQTGQDGNTIVRIRGEALLWLLTATAGGDGFQVGMGICLVSDEAFAIGATAIPSPATDDDWDGWMWHRTVMLYSRSPLDGTDAGVGVGPSARVEIDCKAMRKFEEGYTVCAVMEFTEHGTAVLEFTGRTRMLIKLP